MGIFSAENRGRRRKSTGLVNPLTTEEAAKARGIIQAAIGSKADWGSYCQSLYDLVALGLSRGGSVRTIADQIGLGDPGKSRVGEYARACGRKVRPDGFDTRADWVRAVDEAYGIDVEAREAEKALRKAAGDVFFDLAVRLAAEGASIETIADAASAPMADLVQEVGKMSNLVTV